jgi:AcrR family transcriptional regulator
MQPASCHHLRKRLISSSADNTRQRLLDAAAETLNRRGIQGATTREIARRAGVHEVTLFRHFKSKEKLLRAILKRGLAVQATILDEKSSRRESLRESMEKYGRHYYSRLEKNKGFAGALLAGHVLPKSMQTLITDVIHPGRERLVSVLADAQKAGVVRSEVHVECALHAINGALYAGILRQGAYIPQNYSIDTYISTVVEIFVRGIEPANNGNCRTALTTHPCASIFTNRQSVSNWTLWSLDASKWD